MLARGSALPAFLRRTIFVNLRVPYSRDVFRNPRTVSSFSVVATSPSIEKDDHAVDRYEDLRSQIFLLRLPKRSATAVLEKWIEEGKSIEASELRKIVKELKLTRRYKHALEIIEWMKARQEFDLSKSDYAIWIEMITNVFGVNAAEEFFKGIPSTGQSCEAFTALLHSFSVSGLTDKAESLFERIKENYPSSTISYNEMMTLYMSLGQPDKIFSVIEDLKARKASPDLFTFNLWISACAANNDICGIRKILDEMSQDSNRTEGWETYAKLIDMYLTAGNFTSSDNSLVKLDETNSHGKLITYDFLIFLHAGLGNKEKVSVIWRSLHETGQKRTIRSYLCVLSSHLVLGNLKEVGEIIDEWQQSPILDFETSACNRLFHALLKCGLIETAESFHELMLQKNCELER